MKTATVLRPHTLLLAALALTAAVYWLGLSGPFIFDDESALEPIRLWQAGHASFLEVLFPHPSLVFSRPVSMASFALTTWLGGDTSFSFKFGNLVVHLACGLIGWRVLLAALKRDARLNPHAELLAAILAAFWLLHPLQVSTVLYAVQRMAQLSTLFALAAVWVYLIARGQLIEGRTRQSRLNLFVSFPVLMLLGILSKQNAAVAPAICLALELAYFSAKTRPGRTMAAFFGAFLALPIAGAAAILVLAPDKLLGTYAEWNFTLLERLLTQPRALMDYIGLLLFPRGPLMGLYTDDFAVSYGLLSPPSTLIALLALAGISVAAVALRKRAPSLLAGWFFFLAAHAVESGFLPLEMYYEHRNYLPSFGLLLALAGLIAVVPAFHTNVLSPRRLGLMGAGGLLMVLSFATLGRVLVWQDFGTIAQMGVQAHPDSMRARYDVASWSLRSGDHETAQDAFGHLAASGNPQHRQLGNLSLLTVNCMRGVDEDNLGLLHLATSEQLPVITTFEAQSLLLLSKTTKDKSCPGLPLGVVASQMKRIIDAAQAQPESATPKTLARYALSEIYARNDQPLQAQEQAEIAWKGGRDKKIGAFLAMLYIQHGQRQSARELLPQLEKIIAPHEKQGQEILAHLRISVSEDVTSIPADVPPGNPAPARGPTK